MAVTGMPPTEMFLVRKYFRPSLLRSSVLSLPITSRASGPQSPMQQVLPVMSETCTHRAGSAAECFLASTRR